LIPLSNIKSSLSSYSATRYSIFLILKSRLHRQLIYLYQLHHVILCKYHPIVLKILNKAVSALDVLPT
jgi:hypothetical protein